MSDPSKTYSSLVVQPIDLINAFKLDFCLASVVKWMTKWHMDNKSEYLRKVMYYIDLCHDSPIPVPFMFSLRMYCMVNGFMEKDAKTCEMLELFSEMYKKDFDRAHWLANCWKVKPL